MSTEDISKMCPNCKRKDVTSFSKCKFCGTRYDAKIAAEPRSIDMKIVGVICAALAAFGIFNYSNSTLKEAKTKRLAFITKAVRAANRPRVMEFYADWCGPCHTYGPVIEACHSKYQSQVDFQRFNVEDPASKEAAMAIGVRAIPRTCMFDRHGNEVVDVTGGLSAEELEQRMHELLASK